MCIMASDVVNELNKLKKSELIDIILTGNIPEQISLSEEIRKSLCVKTNNLESKQEESPESEVSDCNNKICLALCRFKNDQIEMLQQIVRIQEKRAIDQELIINLLNNSGDRPVEKIQESVKHTNNTRINSNAKTNDNRSASYSEAAKLTTTTAVKLKESSSRIENKQAKVNFNENKTIEDNSEWKTQKQKKKPIYGTAKETQIKGSMKYSDFHVYRIAPQTTAEDLTEYLKSQGIASVKCLEMDSKHPEEYTSFKVSVPQDYVDKIQNPDTWPQYACVNRFFGRLVKKKQET